MASFTIPSDASPEHFFGVLASVDWYYGFSDSASVFRAGAETANAVEAFAKGKGGMYMRMYADRIAYVSKVTSGHAAQAREPQLKDYIRSDVPIPTIASVRHASKEEISTYLSLRIDDNVAVGKELANGEVYGEEGMKMVRLFLDNHIYDPAITRANKPAFARCSMPLTPNISPAAIGCSVVKLRGDCSRSNRSPKAFKTASGQHSPEDEFTATTMPSLMRATACSAEIFLDIYHLLPRIISAAFSAIAIVVALVFAEISEGMVELSHTRKASMPRTRICVSTTAISSTPILQVPTG